MGSVNQENGSICTICNDRERETTKYALRFTRRDDTSQKVMPALCESCALEMLSTSWIGQQHVEAADD